MTSIFTNLAEPRSQPAEKQKVLIDYILSHLGDDRRPYLKVTILGHPILGLLDSGSSLTIVGLSGFEILQRLGFCLNRSNVAHCVVANGQSCSSIGVVRAPLCLQGKVKIMDLVVVPDISALLILGLDFWVTMEIVPDLKSDAWHFGVESRIDVAGISDHLTPQQRSQLTNLLTDKFRKMGQGLGYTTVAEHEIIVEPGTQPIKRRYYPVSPHKQKLLDQELERMLQLDVIEPSNSPWSSPVLLVPKSSPNEYRFCVDYRALNSVTRKDAYPLPYISAILDRLRGAKYLSSMDIKSAYWQISVKKESRPFTAFTIPGRGLYQFKRMPFGLTNAPASWQRLIDTVLGADLEPFVHVYLDDIIIISPDFETHLEVLNKVFDRLTIAGLTVSEDKCKFCRPSLKYLGYVVDSQGLRVDIEKVDSILKVPSPKTMTEVRRFLGMASWYRRFVPNFSSTIAPLTRLLKKDVKFNWTSDCEKAFTEIKNCLVSAPILTCPDFSREFVLQTDASAYGLGAVLTQTFEDGEKVICFLSRSLSRAERSYSTTERECLCVIWAVEKLRHYLEGTKFTVITDHSSLLWLNRLKDPTGRLARWALRLQPFSFDIIHRKGKDHVVPNFLPRSLPVAVDEIRTEGIPDDLSDTADGWYTQLRDKISSRPEKYPQWRIENNLLYKYVKCKISELSSPSDHWKLVVPKDRRRSILFQHHDDVTAGHIGVNKIYWKICRKYFWPRMRADVIRYVKACKVCAQHKPEQKRPAGLMGTRSPPGRPWQIISLDFVGPLPRSVHGNTHLLVISDYFSKFVLLFPLRKASAKNLCSHLENSVFLLFGVPQVIICDNGVQMRSRDFDNLCNKYQVKIHFTPLYYPRADPCERVNKVVKTMMACYVKENQKKWDEHLSAIRCAINSSQSEVTGFSPYFVNFGREYVSSGVEFSRRYADATPDVSLEDTANTRIVGFRKMYQKIIENLVKAQERNRRYYNLRRRPVDLAVGEMVWRRSKLISDAAKQMTAKLSPKYLGPFRIKRRVGYCTYELEDDNGVSKGKWHVQDLKPFASDDQD